MISFRIPMTPRSVQFENRAVIRPAKAGRAARPGVIASPKKKRYYRDLAKVASLYAPATPLEGPVKLLVLFGMPRPKYFDKPKKSPARAAKRVHHSVKPDLTNMLKAVEDAISPLGFWLDDCQVSASGARKVYVAPDEEPFILVSIDTLPLYVDQR